MVLLKFIKSYFSDLYFFRVNDNTMRSYYRHLMSYVRWVQGCQISPIEWSSTVVKVLYLHDNYRTYGNHGECRQSRPVFSRPCVNICSVSGANRLLAQRLHIWYIFSTYFRDFWCERKFCTRFYCYSNQKQELFQWFLEKNIEKSMRSYYWHLPFWILWINWLCPLA